MVASAARAPAAGRIGARAWLPALYAGLALSFVLPFVVVSCESAETKPITGIDLVAGTRPEFLDAGSPDDRDDVLDMVDGRRGPAQALLMAAVAGALLALLATVRLGGCAARRRSGHRLDRLRRGCAGLGLAAAPMAIVVLMLLAE
jgi:hypothetical protein